MYNLNANLWEKFHEVSPFTARYLIAQQVSSNYRAKEYLQMFTFSNLFSKVTNTRRTSPWSSQRNKGILMNFHSFRRCETDVFSLCTCGSLNVRFYAIQRCWIFHNRNRDEVELNSTSITVSSLSNSIFRVDIYIFYIYKYF